jgi:hypothetical protein
MMKRFFTRVPNSSVLNSGSLLNLEIKVDSIAFHQHLNESIKFARRGWLANARQQRVSQCTGTSHARTERNVLVQQEQGISPLIFFPPG